VSAFSAANRRISKGGFARAAQTPAPRVAQSFAKIDRIPSVDIRYSLFDIRFFKVSFSIKLATLEFNRRRPAAGLTPET
jgi:hypothetical protein